MAFGIIHQAIFDSSVAVDWRARVVFQDLIVLADEEDNVVMTPAALSHRSRMPLEMVEHALSILTAPDAESRQTDYEGRRILLMRNADTGKTIGFHVVNREYYKHLMSEDRRRQYHRAYMRRYREEKRAPSQAELAGSQRSAESAEALRELREERG